MEPLSYLRFLFWPDTAVFCLSLMRLSVVFGSCLLDSLAKATSPWCGNVSGNALCVDPNAIFIDSFHDLPEEFYVTMLDTSDRYVPGVLALAASLLDAKATRPFVVVVVGGEPTAELLLAAQCMRFIIKRARTFPLRIGTGPGLFSWNRFSLWVLPARRIVALGSDTVVLRNTDDLFADGPNFRAVRIVFNRSTFNADVISFVPSVSTLYGMLDALASRTYDKAYELWKGFHCGGDPIHVWERGGDAFYAWHLFEIRDCQKVCSEHPECKGFVSRHSDNRCSYWQGGDLVYTRSDAYEFPTWTPNDRYDCYEKLEHNFAADQYFLNQYFRKLWRTQPRARLPYTYNVFKMTELAGGINFDEVHILHLIGAKPWHNKKHIDNVIYPRSRDIWTGAFDSYLKRCQSIPVALVLKDSVCVAASQTV